MFWWSLTTVILLLQNYAARLNSFFKLNLLTKGIQEMIKCNLNFLQKWNGKQFSCLSSTVQQHLEIRQVKYFSKTKYEKILFEGTFVYMYDDTFPINLTFMDLNLKIPKIERKIQRGPWYRWTVKGMSKCIKHQSLMNSSVPPVCFLQQAAIFP